MKRINQKWNPAFAMLIAFAMVLSVLSSALAASDASESTGQDKRLEIAADELDAQLQGAESKEAESAQEETEMWETELWEPESSWGETELAQADPEDAQESETQGQEEQTVPVRTAQEGQTAHAGAAREEQADGWETQGSEGPESLGKPETIGLESEELPIDQALIAGEIPGTTSGNLVIRKEVKNEPSNNETFDFIVELTPPYSGNYGGVEFVDGKGQVSVAAGQQVKIPGIPAVDDDNSTRTKYNVTEVGADDYICEITPQTGWINDSTDITVTCTNTRKGSLTVTKTVTGNSGDRSREWTFRVSLLKSAGGEVDTSINETYEDTQFNNGIAEFQLRHGESKTITGLPVGAFYKVEELGANTDGYTTTVSDSGGGVIPPDGKAQVSFTNEKDQNIGSLTVSKTVQGNAGETDREWHFTVTLLQSEGGPALRSSR